MLVIDFDGVLLDDARFKRDYIRMFGDFGIPEEAYRQAYQKIKKDNGGWYTPDLHIRVLKKRYPEAEAGLLKKEAHLFASHARNYLYPDAREFLARAKAGGEKIVLLSSGPEFQGRKVEGSGLQDYFDDIKIIKQSSKLASLKALLRQEHPRLIFIDDKREIVDEVKRALPEVFAIQVQRRSDQEKSFLADAVVGDLREAAKILRKKFPWKKTEVKK